MSKITGILPASAELPEDLQELGGIHLRHVEIEQDGGGEAVRQHAVECDVTSTNDAVRTAAW